MKCSVTSISELQNQIKGNLYCFGAGRAFDGFMKEFANLKLEKNIKAVVDNGVKGFEISVKIVNGNTIPIIPLEKMLVDITDDDCILITTASYEEIIEQLEKIDRLESTEYFVYSMMRIAQYDYDRLTIKMPLSLSVYEEIKIPKVIHYCWFGKKKMPFQYKEWMQSWRRFCPDYEMIEWNESNYDVRKGRYVSQAYDAGKWAFVSDYARIDIINKYGGVYLDTDVELVKNIDALLMNDAFCGFESFNYVAYGLGFGSKKENPLLSEMLEYYDNIEFLSADGKLNQTTCPVIQTEIMKRHGLVCNGEFQIVDGMTVYPSRVLCGMSPHSFRIAKDFADTYAIHHYAASWVDDCREKNRLISYMNKWSDDSSYFYAR